MVLSRLTLDLCRLEIVLDEGTLSIYSIKLPREKQRRYSYKVYDDPKDFLILHNLRYKPGVLLG